MSLVVEAVTRVCVPKARFKLFPAIVPRTSVRAPMLANDRAPAPFVTNAWPDDPSAVGHVKSTLFDLMTAAAPVEPNVAAPVPVMVVAPTVPVRL